MVANAMRVGKKNPTSHEVGLKISLIMRPDFTHATIARLLQRRQMQGQMGRLINSCPHDSSHTRFHQLFVVLKQFPY
jgi:hypothetical protein